MNPIVVYYHISVMDDTIMMALTSKDFWDANHCLDDGAGPHQEAIAIAMANCGMYEAFTSVYELECMDDEAGIVADMRKHGFDLQSNPDFTDFLGG